MFRSCCRVRAGMVVSGDCSLLVTISRDQSVKVFDVAGFDMVLMLKLKFVPAAAEWIYRVCACCCLPTWHFQSGHWRQQLVHRGDAFRCMLKFEWGNSRHAASACQGKVSSDCSSLHPFCCMPGAQRTTREVTRTSPCQNTK